jgi:hypothetical protein
MKKRSSFECDLIIELDGREVYRGPSRSFVQNFAITYMSFILNSAQNVTQPDGTTGKIQPAISACTVWFNPILSMAAGDNDDTNGIWVGSGSTPVSPTDYKLASKIPHGTGAGQLDYEPQSVTASYTDTQSYVEISRAFVNRTSDNITVAEVGLVAFHKTGYNSTTYAQARELIARDVLPQPITLAPLSALTVKYRITLSL